MTSRFRACALTHEQAGSSAATRPQGTTSGRGGGDQGLRAASSRCSFGRVGPSDEMRASLPPVLPAHRGRTAAATTVGVVPAFIIRRNGRRNQTCTRRKQWPRDHPGEPGRHNRGRPALALTVTALATVSTGCGLTPSAAGSRTSTPSTPAPTAATTAPVQIPARAELRERSPGRFARPPIRAGRRMVSVRRGEQSIGTALRRHRLAPSSGTSLEWRDLGRTPYRGPA